MTRVLYEPNAFHLRIEGHAGSAPKGDDLVCAGISALGFAMLLAAGEEDYNAEIQTDPDNGIMDVRCKPSGLYGRDHCAVMMDTIAGGLELMESQFPEYIKFERRE